MQKTQLSGRRFERYFQAYWQRQESVPAWVLQMHKVLMPFFHEACNTVTQSNIRLVDLGGGDGSLLSLLAKTMPERFFHITANDVSHGALDRYQKCMQGFVDIIPTRLEQAHLHIPYPVDLLIAVHSLYGTDLSDMLAPLRKRLTDGGQIWIVLDDDQSAFTTWRKMHWQTVHEVDWDETSCADIRSACERLDLSYDERMMTVQVHESTWSQDEHWSQLCEWVLRSEDVPQEVVQAMQAEASACLADGQAMRAFQIHC